MRSAISSLLSIRRLGVKNNNNNNTQLQLTTPATRLSLQAPNTQELQVTMKKKSFHGIHVYDVFCSLFVDNMARTLFVYQLSSVHARFLYCFRSVTSGLRRPFPLACVVGHAVVFAVNAIFKAKFLTFGFISSGLGWKNPFWHVRQSWCVFCFSWWCWQKIKRRLAFF